MMIIIDEYFRLLEIFQVSISKVDTMKSVSYKGLIPYPNANKYNASFLKIFFSKKRGRLRLFTHDNEKLNAQVSSGIRISVLNNILGFYSTTSYSQ